MPNIDLLEVRGEYFPFIPETQPSVLKKKLIYVALNEI